MFTGNPVDTTRAEQPGGISPAVHSVLAVFFQRNLDHRRSDGRGINISGVDFWHAVEFSRNGRFLCTHPLGLSSGLSFGISCFQPYQIRFPFRFRSGFVSGGGGSGLLLFGLSPTLSEAFPPS